MKSLREYLVGKYPLADGRVKHPGPDHPFRVDRGLSDVRPDFCQIWARCPDEAGNELELQLSNAPHDRAIRAWVEAHGGTFSASPDPDRATYTVSIRGNLYRAVKSLGKHFAPLSARGKATAPDVSVNDRKLRRRMRAVLTSLAGDLKAFEVLKLAGSTVPDQTGRTGLPGASPPSSTVVPGPSAVTKIGRRRNRHLPPDPDDVDLFALLGELPAPAPRSGMEGTGT
jgi:hypothetical protein